MINVPYLWLVTLDPRVPYLSVAKSTTINERQDREDGTFLVTSTIGGYYGGESPGEAKKLMEKYDIIDIPNCLILGREGLLYE